jgi:hypothetical protein
MATRRTLPPAPRVRVTVSDVIIEQAVPRDSGHCMVADGISASVPGSTHASADIATLRFSDPEKGLRYIYLTPRSVQEKLIGFDMGLKPEPFSFELRAGQTVRMNRRDRVTKKRSRSQGPGQEHGLDTAHRMLKRGDGVPDIVGGEPPPTGALAGGAGIPAGRRRSFGLRSMDRVR